MKLTTIKYMGIGSFFLLTTGIFMPWLISTNLLPTPFIILGMFLLTLIWLAIIEKPFIKFFKYFGKFLNENK